MAGDAIDPGIDAQLERADIILLLVSPDFLASDYCYGVEMTRALERHGEGTARVIPVILRPCEWHEAPFGKLLAAPTDGKAVTKFPNRDDAFLEITKAIRTAAQPAARPAQKPTPKPPPSTAPTATAPRSSNLRVRSDFTQRDRHVFLEECYEYMAAFFENSVAELATRNKDIDADFKRLDATRFRAVAYRNGEERVRCLIRLGGFSGEGITLSYGRHDLAENSINESMSVVAGEQSLTLEPLGMPMRGSKGRHLSAEGAAEYYWDLFIEPLQR